MGAGASTLLVNEQNKPLDASDIAYGDYAAARAEVVRMRELMSLLDVDKLPVKKSPPGPFPVNEYDDTVSEMTETFNNSRKSPFPGQQQQLGADASTPGRQQAQQENTPGTEANSGLESREGQDYWRTKWGTTQPEAPKTPKKDDGTSDDRGSSLESREGQNYWKQQWGTGPVSQSITGSPRKEKTTPTDDKMSADESAEGKAYWDSISRAGSRAPTGLRMSPAHARQDLSPVMSPRSVTSAAPTISEYGTAQELVNKVRQKTFAKYDDVRKAFMKFDYDRSGYISRQEFRNTMAEMGMPLSDEEFDIINDSYPHKEAPGQPDKGIGYLEFVKLMTDELHYVPGEGEDEASEMYYGKTTMNSASRSVTPMAQSMTGDQEAGRPFTQGQSVSSSLRNNFAKKIFGKFSDMKKAFHAADRDGSGFIEPDEFAALLWETLDIKATDDEVLDLLALIDTNGDGKVSFGEFVKCLHTL
jgi:Ca2+-binding EF-hand superfamily protein